MRRTKLDSRGVDAHGVNVLRCCLFIRNPSLSFADIAVVVPLPLLPARARVGPALLHGTFNEEGQSYMPEPVFHSVLSVQEGAEKRETGNSSTVYLTHYCTPCSGHWPLRICAVHYSILNLSNSIRAAPCPPCGGEGEGGGGRPCARWCSAPEPEPDPSNLDPSPNLDPSNLDPSNLDPSPRSCACV